MSRVDSVAKRAPPDRSGMRRGATDKVLFRVVSDLLHRVLQLGVGPAVVGINRRDEGNQL
jgi:hypothetical protein